jgi:hypothetical protein
MEIRGIDKGIYGVERPNRPGASQKANESRPSADQVELSEDAALFAAAKTAVSEASSFDAPHRAERVREAQARVANGFYDDNPGVRDVVLARLVESVLGLDHRT